MKSDWEMKPFLGLFTLQLGPDGISSAFSGKNFVPYGELKHSGRMTIYIKKEKAMEAYNPL
jgi:hypothetical protein